MSYQSKCYLQSYWNSDVRVARRFEVRLQYLNHELQQQRSIMPFECFNSDLKYVCSVRPAQNSQLSNAIVSASSPGTAKHVVAIPSQLRHVAQFNISFLNRKARYFRFRLHDEAERPFHGARGAFQAGSGRGQAHHLSVQHQQSQTPFL